MDTNSTTPPANEVRLDAYFATLWRAKWLIILVVLAAVTATFLYARQQPTRHTATATVEVGRVWKEPLADTYVVEQTVNGRGFMRELGQKLGINANQLQQRIQAETVTAGPNRTRYPILLKITATTPDEGESIRLAQAAADELIARHEKLFDEALTTHRARQQRLEGHLKKLQGQANSPSELVLKVEDELDDVTFNNTSPTATKKTALIEPVVAITLAPPSPWRNAASAAVLAALACVALVVLATYLKPVLRAANRKDHD